MKPFITIKEAAELTGLSQFYLRIGRRCMRTGGIEKSGDETPLFIIKFRIAYIIRKRSWRGFGPNWTTCGSWCAAAADPGHVSARIPACSPALLGALGAQEGRFSCPRPALILARLRTGCSVQISADLPPVIFLADQIRAQVARGSQKTISEKKLCDACEC